MNKKPRELYGIFRIDTRSDNGRSTTHGWQVRLTYNKKPFNKLFSDSVCGSRDEALMRAKEFRDQRLIEFNRNAGFLRKVSTELNSSNTSGIIGVNRTEYLEKSSSISEIWQTAFPTVSGKVGTKSMSIHKKGEMATLKIIINARMEGMSDLIGTAPYILFGSELRFLVDYYLNILVFFDSLSKQEEDEILAVINSSKIVNTDKADIINGRVGQGSYRERLLMLWGNKCAVTGAKLFIVASHIKPWVKSTDIERLDVYNGIPLSPVYDKAFDSGYITFNTDGSIVISEEFSDDGGKMKIDSTENIGEVHPFSHMYLEFHRNKIYRGKLF